jgi:large subunit ribosomal protein L30
MSEKKISVTLVKSLCKKTVKQKACASGLGLRRIRQTVKLDDTPSIRGMINAISFMLKVED